MLKLKMMLCVMMLPLVLWLRKAVCQSVRGNTTPPGVDNAASPGGRHAERIISPSERLITIRKQLEGTQEVY